MALSGTQAVPPTWVVVVSGLAALVVVWDVRGWHLARNAITIAHEGGRALVSVLSGRRLEGIRLHSDTSGETVSRGRGSRPGMVLTAAAGYLTPPLLGAGAAVLLFTRASALVTSKLTGLPPTQQRAKRWLVPSEVAGS